VSKRSISIIAGVVAFFMAASCKEAAFVFLSESERDYYNYMEQALSDPLSPPNEQFINANAAQQRGLHQCCLDWAAAIPQATSRRLNEARLRTPPPLFALIHRHAIERWQSLLPVMRRLSRIGRRMCNRIPDVQAQATDPDDAQQHFQQILSDAQPDIDIVDHQAKAIDATFRIAMETDFQQINREVKGRLPFGSTATANAPHLTVSVSYQPYFIPVKVSVNSDGEVEVSAESAVPTPVGVFSVGASVTVPFRRKRLTVIYGNKQTVFAMSDRPFVFQVVHFSGDVNIRYDDRGNVTIELRGAKSNVRAA
jgi:hypothetical protein